MLRLVRTHLKPLLIFSTRRSRQSDKILPSINKTSHQYQIDSAVPCIRPLFHRGNSGLIQKATNKQCQLDPIPTRVVKQCCDLLAPAISAIINNSFTNGEFPNSLKSAIVRPIIKKTNMDPFDLKSWRLISNLRFLSKLVERVAVSRLNEHLGRYDLLPPRQSAYRAHHSTETAVTAVVNEIA